MLSVFRAGLVSKSAHVRVRAAAVSAAVTEGACPAAAAAVKLWLVKAGAGLAFDHACEQSRGERDRLLVAYARIVSACSTDASSVLADLGDADDNSQRAIVLLTAESLQRLDRRM